MASHHKPLKRTRVSSLTTYSASIATVRNARRRQRAVLRQFVRKRRPVHKRVLLHPASAMALLVAGVLIGGWTFRVAADSYTITAKNPAPLLTDGAIITEPSDGAIFKTTPITVSGSCPNDSYVELMRNGIASGTAGCISNTFTIDTTLSEGLNSLQAQDYNITDDPGPATPAITVTYIPPSPPPSTTPTSPSSQSPPPSASSSQPLALVLQSDYQFRAFSVGSTVTWQLKASGGTLPYDIRVLWDSHTVSSWVVNAHTFAVSHTYTAAGFYAVKVYITDAAGMKTMLQLFVLIKQPGAIGVLQTAPTQPPTWWNELVSALLSGTNRWLLVAWPAYMTVVLMAISYWLGERQIMEHITVRQQIRKRRSIPHR